MSHNLGGLAQSVECVVRNDEAPGSKPGFSTFCYSGAWMAEWSKALDLSSSGRKSAWVRTPLQALFWLKIGHPLESNPVPKSDPRGIRTPSLWIWNPTRCRCAMESFSLNWLVPRPQQLVQGWGHDVGWMQAEPPLNQRTGVIPMSHVDS